MYKVDLGLGFFLNQLDQEKSKILRPTGNTVMGFLSYVIK